MKDALLMIFTRNPRLGRVKTRLAQTVGNKTALEIYIFLLEHTHKITRDIQVEKAVYYSDDIPPTDLWESSKFSKKQQTGSDLGVRMKNAFEASLKEYNKVIIIGSDIYDLTTAHLEEAFKQLEHHDVVIGPAQDGGYYLLGMKKLHPSIFKNKQWGTSTVLTDTLKDLEHDHVHLLEVLNDVDVIDDIKEHPAFQSFLKEIKP